MEIHGRRLSSISAAYVDEVKMRLQRREIGRCCGICRSCGASCLFSSVQTFVSWIRIQHIVFTIFNTLYPERKWPRCDKPQGVLSSLTSLINFPSTLEGAYGPSLFSVQTNRVYKLYDSV